LYGLILVEGGETKVLPSQPISAEPSNFTEENEGSEVIEAIMAPEIGTLSELTTNRLVQLVEYRTTM